MNSNHINGGTNNFDSYLKGMMDNYQPQPSKGLWGKVHMKLLKKDVLDFVSFKKLTQSLNPVNKTLSSQIKVWVSYAAAACLTAGLVFGAVYIPQLSNKNNLTDNHNPNIIGEKHEIIHNKEIQRPVNNGDNIETYNDLQEKSDNENKNIRKLPDQNNNSNPNNVQNNDQLPINNNQDKLVQENDVKQTQKNNSNPADKDTMIVKEVIKENKVDNEELTHEMMDSLYYTMIDSSFINHNNNNGHAYDLVFPNVITPNNDGYNDYFVIKNLEKYPDNTLIVMDRNGKVVYNNSNYNNNWSAEGLPDGVYYFYLTYKDTSRYNHMKNGTLYVLR